MKFISNEIHDGEKTAPDLPNFATYMGQNVYDNALGNAQLVIRCPLDNGQTPDASIPAGYSAIYNR